VALPPTPSGPEPSGNPLMDDILVSIRKILNEDDAGKSPGEVAAEPHYVAA